MERECKSMMGREWWRKMNTVKPLYSASAFNKIPPIEHDNFGPTKHFHSYSQIGNSKNLGLEHYSGIF